MRLSGENITIDRRYRGPTESANGGYAAGRLAAYVDGAAEVTLRLPPPLERPLRIVEDDGRVLLCDGDDVVAEAVRAAPEIDVPAPPTLEQATDAAARHIRFDVENFSECFSCGVRPADGLCIHVGPVAGRNVQAAPWAAREVSPEVVWAAIDCAGAYAVEGQGRGEVLLGRMSAEIRRLPDEGEQCIVAAWPLGEDGRKLHAGTALFSAEGELLALAKQTWIAPKERLKQ